VAAAVTLLVGAGFWYGRPAPGPPLGELAKVYSGSRRMDLRILGAAHAPRIVERSRAGSRSPQLLESEAVIEQHLRSHPDDWIWLHARGRAQLLEWRYDESIRSLRSALDRSGASSGPRYAEMLMDLAIAYYERAEAGERPTDYSSAIEYLSRVVQLYPSLPVAYFNRAIVFEKKFDYFHAMEDWQRYLALDARGAWPEEARARLAELKHKMGASRRDQPNRLTDLTEYRQFRAAAGESDRPGKLRAASLPRLYGIVVQM
jgi:tetratricopeptide (TPR) repeat protein